MPKVSVVVAVYNAEKYLKCCLESLTSQTLRDMEIICVDDGSMDGSLAYLQEWATVDARIRVLQQTNRGTAAARNQGLRLATGEYIIFLDADDYFATDLLEKTIRKAEQFAADMVAFRAVSFDDKTGLQSPLNDKIGQYPHFLEAPFNVNAVPEDIFNSFMVVAWNKLYRKSFIDKFGFQFQAIQRSNDLLFTCQTLVEAQRILLSDDVLLYYRTGNKSSLQTSNDASPLAFYQALFALKEYLSARGYEALVFKSYVKLVLNIVFYNLNRIQSREWKKEVMKFLKDKGLRELGITAAALHDAPLLERWQYQVLMSDLKGTKEKLLSILYSIKKICEYYRLAGIRGTLYKIKSKLS